MYLAIKFPLPKPVQPVARRELTLNLNNRTDKIYLLPGTALESDEILFADKDSYRLTLVDIDAAGNRSLPSNALSDEVSVLPERPGDLWPARLEKKRLLTDEQAKQLQAQLDQKAAAELKAEQARALEATKAEEERQKALAEIDASAAAAKAKV